MKWELAPAGWRDRPCLTTDVYWINTIEITPSGLEIDLDADGRSVIARVPVDKVIALLIANGYRVETP